MINGEETQALLALHSAHFSKTITELLVNEVVF